MHTIRRRTVVLFVAMSLGHLLLISWQIQSKSGLPLIQALAFGAFARVQLLTASVADGGRSLWSNYVALHGVARENEALKRHALELEGQLQQAQARAGEVAALEALLALQRSVTIPTLAARVIAGDPTLASAYVTIDRGSADGVTPDMAVIAARGVVGRVVGRPLAHAAQVQLIISHNASAGAILERTGTGGIIEGVTIDRPFRMTYVPNLADVQPGDRVLTNGQDVMFPKGFLLGTVEKVVPGSGGDRAITVRPAVDFSHIELVLVILEKPVRPGGGGA